MAGEVPRLKPAEVEEIDEAITETRDAVREYVLLALCEEMQNRGMKLSRDQLDNANQIIFADVCNLVRTSVSEFFDRLKDK
jgi:hypothetical protein